MVSAALRQRVVWVASFAVLLLSGVMFQHFRRECQSALRAVPVAELGKQLSAKFIARRTTANCMGPPTVNMALCLVLIVPCLLGWVKGSTLNLVGQVEHLYFELDPEGRTRLDSAARLCVVTIAFAVTIVVGTVHSGEVASLRGAHSDSDERLYALSAMCICTVIAAVFGARYLQRLMRAEWIRSASSR